MPAARLSGASWKRWVDPTGAQIADELADRVHELSWPQLAWFADGNEHRELTGARGGPAHRVRVHGTWDMDPWNSDVLIWVTVRPLLLERPGFPRHRRSGGSDIEHLVPADLPLAPLKSAAPPWAVA